MGRRLFGRTAPAGRVAGATLAALTALLIVTPATTSASASADAASIRVPVSLRGSLNAMVRQNAVARENGYAFARTQADIDRLVAEGELVRLEGSEDYAFRAGMTNRVARPEMRVFIERLAARYRAACGETLVVTSLTRPQARQPSNAHRLSVHPAGMAADFRISQRAECRQWLENDLLALEREGVLDGIRERSPPHYHVALFPDRYMAYVEPRIAHEARFAPALFPGATRDDAPRHGSDDGARAGIESGAVAGIGWWLLLLVLPVAAGITLLSPRPSPPMTRRQAATGWHGPPLARTLPRRTASAEYGPIHGKGASPWSSPPGSISPPRCRNASISARAATRPV